MSQRSILSLIFVWAALCGLFFAVSLVPVVVPVAEAQNPTRTPSPAVTYITATPAPSLTASPTPAVTAIPTRIATLIPGVFGGDVATWTPPPPAGVFDGTFLLRRPFADTDVTYWARNYSYGSTDRGNRRIHNGLDFPNPAGTAILAAGDGIVYYAGSDVEFIFGPQPDFYGNLVVIEHTAFLLSDGTKLYTLYGHMREFTVATGEEVKAGDVIGFVGATGVAVGSHLHLEVRLGDPTSYYVTRNPELWLFPYANTGVVAGRVADVYGRPLEGVQIEVKSPGVYSQAWSYSGIYVNSGLLFNENFVVPDVPAGYQTVLVTAENGTIRFREVVYVWPGKVTFVNIALLP